MEKEGYLRKRSGRMHRWSLRYFTLKNNKITYKVKADSPILRGEFDLVPGCIVTEVTEELVGTIGSKKYFTLWIIWPGDKNAKSDSSSSANDSSIISSSSSSNSNVHAAAGIDDHDYFSEDEDELAAGAAQVQKPKDLKNIVESEVHKQKYAQKKVDEQLERHKAHDQNVSIGAKVAALAIGGVVVGALTAGIGLVPYITVVGMTAVAGGGAVLAAKRPGDSRLIMAFETMWEATAWKNAIEMQIRSLEPTFPSYTDPHLISFLSEYNKSLSAQTWTRVTITQGMRIMRQIRPLDDHTTCYRAQLVVPTSPIKAFLALMEGGCWPKKGFIKVLKVLDNHIDQLRVQVDTEQSSLWRLGRRTAAKRSFNLTRFWKLDDDGTYLMAITNTTSGYEPCQHATMNSSSSSSGESKHNSEKVDNYSIDAVLSISPRQDSPEYDEDILECLVRCTCQLTSTSWDASEIDHFLKDFLKEHLLDFRASVVRSKYGVEDRLYLDRGSDALNLVTGPVRDVVISVGNSAAAEGSAGDESLGMSSYVRNAGREESKDATVIKTEKKRFFKRKLHLFSGGDRGGVPSDGLSSSGGRLGIEMPTDQSESRIGSTSSSPYSQRRFTKSSRSSIINSEASSLRGRIASKEYELQRMERSMKAKKEKADRERGRERDRSVDSSRDVQQQGLYSEQLSDLRELKQEYEHLTGTPYEQVKRFGALKRVLKIGSTSSSSLLPSDSSTPISTKDKVSKPPPRAERDAAAHLFRPGPGATNSDYPASWQPLALPLSRGKSAGANDLRVNVIVLFLFAFCIAATMLMANLLSSF